MRRTWDALARDGDDAWVGPPLRARDELDALFGRLGGEPTGTRCLELGCGYGRMTVELARRFPRVLAVDVSPRMLARARAAMAEQELENVELRVVSGTRLDGVPSAFADVAVCYLVLQHVPSARVLRSLLSELRRVLAPAGEGFVQLPVLLPGVTPVAWNAVRSVGIPAASLASRAPTAKRAFRGFRPSERQLGRVLERSGLSVTARDDDARSPYRFTRSVFLRLRAAGVHEDTNWRV
jgi:SAM-dependent methyltransferase